MTIKNPTLVSSLLLALSLQTVSIQSATAANTRFSKIASHESLLENMVGRTLTSRNYSLTINADYTLDGSYRGEKMMGKWLFVSNEAICFDMATSVHCVAPSVDVNDSSSIRFDRPETVRNTLYWRNPYPNLWGEYTVSQ